MNRKSRLATVAGLALGTAAVAAPEPDPRLREVFYDPNAVVTVPVKRGVVTLVMLDADEAITEVAAGLGGDCTKAESAWCVAAQPGGRNLFIKAKSSASAPNTLAVVTDRRTHSFRFVLLANGDPKAPVYRLVVRAPPRPAPTLRPAPPDMAAPLALPPLPPPPLPEQVVAERLQAKPLLLNSQYSVAEGIGSQDIVPTLVFDDGRFTYLLLPGNREVPAVFHVLGDGSETLGNGIPAICEMSLMPVTAQWLPIDDSYERQLVDHLVAEGRAFIKGLRYNLARNQPIAAATLMDMGGTAPHLFVLPPGLDDAASADRTRTTTPGGDAPWIWRPAAEPLPCFPPAIRSTRAKASTQVSVLTEGVARVPAAAHREANQL